MSARFQALAPAEVSLGPGVFQYRAELNRRYLLSLTLDNLLQNHYLEAGLGGYSRLRNSSHGDADSGDHRHWGWESPTCQVRGQFLGHWMSAAARLGAGGDAELRLRLEQVVHSPDEYMNETQASAAYAIKSQLLLSEIARAEKLEVTDEDVDKEIAAIAARTGRKALAVRARLEAEKKLDQFRNELRGRKLADFLLAHNTVEKVPAKPAETQFGGVILPEAGSMGIIKPAE